MKILFFALGVIFIFFCLALVPILNTTIGPSRNTLQACYEYQKRGLIEKHVKELKDYGLEP